jgi:hypothetical protein
MVSYCLLAAVVFFGGIIFRVKVDLCLHITVDCFPLHCCPRKCSSPALSSGRTMVGRDPATLNGGDGARQDIVPKKISLMRREKIHYTKYL